MKSMSALKEEIDSLLPRERQELLEHITARVAADSSQKALDTFPLEGSWADGGESDAQYVIPESNYRTSLVRQKEKKPEDDLS